MLISNFSSKASNFAGWNKMAKIADKMQNKEQACSKTNTLGGRHDEKRKETDDEAWSHAGCPGPDGDYRECQYYMYLGGLSGRAAQERQQAP